MASHRIKFRVYYEDTDAGGIVYHARYLAFAERARTEAIRSVGISVVALAEEVGLHFVVRKADLRFRGALRLDDEMEIETSLTGMTPTRLLLLQTCRNATRDYEISTIVNVELACLTVNTMRPSKIPPHWCVPIQKLADGLT